jgi:hypothetical protein
VWKCYPDTVELTFKGINFWWYIIGLCRGFFGGDLGGQAVGVQYMTLYPYQIECNSVSLSLCTHFHDLHEKFDTDVLQCIKGRYKKVTIRSSPLGELTLIINLISGESRKRVSEWPKVQSCSWDEIVGAKKIREWWGWANCSTDSIASAMYINPDNLYKGDWLQ